MTPIWVSVSLPPEIDRQAIHNEGCNGTCRVIMMSPNETVTKMMLKTGFLPGKGLGKEEQGIKQPIVPKQKMDRRGLGEDRESIAPNHSFS